MERYLNLLDHGVPVERIAAITFTKKAAQEMKDRICRIRPELVADLERAQISTIHSLCQRIIQEHPLEAAVDPRFAWEKNGKYKRCLFRLLAISSMARNIRKNWGGLPQMWWS